jgi:hypothetical protein
MNRILTGHVAILKTAIMKLEQMTARSIIYSSESDDNQEQVLEVDGALPQAVVDFSVFVDVDRKALHLDSGNSVLEENELKFQIERLQQARLEFLEIKGLIEQTNSSSIEPMSTISIESHKENSERNVSFDKNGLLFFDKPGAMVSRPEDCVKLSPINEDDNDLADVSFLNAKKRWHERSFI